MKIAFASALILTLTNCASVPTNTKALVSVPAEPYLPSISDKELSCLPDQTYERLAKRDQAWRLYSEKLKAIID
jgi:hypothetical protein